MMVFNYLVIFIICYNLAALKAICLISCRSGNLRLILPQAPDNKCEFVYNGIPSESKSTSSPGKMKFPASRSPSPSRSSIDRRNRSLMTLTNSFASPDVSYHTSAKKQSYKPKNKAVLKLVDELQGTIRSADNRVAVLDEQIESFHDILAFMKGAFTDTNFMIDPIYCLKRINELENYGIQSQEIITILKKQVKELKCVIKHSDAKYAELDNEFKKLRDELFKAKRELFKLTALLQTSKSNNLLLTNGVLGNTELKWL